VTVSQPLIRALQAESDVIFLLHMPTPAPEFAVPKRIVSLDTGYTSTLECTKRAVPGWEIMPQHTSYILWLVWEPFAVTLYGRRSMRLRSGSRLAPCCNFCLDPLGSISQPCIHFLKKRFMQALVQVFSNIGGGQGFQGIATETSCCCPYTADRAVHRHNCLHEMAYFKF
jgi:hypothetical protein